MVSINKPRMILVGMMAVFLCGGCGDDEPAMLVASETAGEVEVAPADGTITIPVVIENVGQETAHVIDIAIANGEHEVGTFGFQAGYNRPSAIEPGAKVTVTVEFRAADGAPSGCDFFATASLRVFTSEGGSVLPNVEVRLYVAGTCDESLRCSPRPARLPDTLINTTSEVSVTCYNLTQSSITVQTVALAEDSDPHLSMAFPRGAPPQSLRPGRFYEFGLGFGPVARGEAAGTVRIQTDAEEVSLGVIGLGMFKRPLCSDSAPTPARPPEEIDGYSFELESTSVMSYHGEVVDTGSVRESYAPMIKTALLLATGSYLAEGCNVSNNGATYRWEGSCDAGAGTLYNVLPIPLTDQLETQIKGVTLGERVRFEGYDIARVVRADQWWSDGGSASGGNRAMLITRVCDVD